MTRKGYGLRNVDGHTGAGGAAELHALAEIVERKAKAGGQIDLRLPAQQLFRPGDVRATLRRIVLGQRMEANLAGRAGDGKNLVRTFEDSPLHGVADVDGVVFAGAREAQNAFDLVGNVTEAAGLGAISVDGEVF